MTIDYCHVIAAYAARSNTHQLGACSSEGALSGLQRASVQYLQWRRSPGGGEGGDCPLPIKIYLGESIFWPPQSFSCTAKKLHQECTKNRHFEIQNQKKFWGGGRGPTPSAASVPRSPPKIYIWIDATDTSQPFAALKQQVNIRSDGCRVLAMTVVIGVA